MLYDQLLRSLTGDEGLASGQEYFRWCQAQAAAGRRDFAPLDLEAPWPIQRYRALTLLQALSWDDYLRIAQTIREAKEIDLLEQDPVPLPPLDEDLLKTEWLQWRSGLIQRYQLEGLVPENPTTSSPESPA